MFLSCNPPLDGIKRIITSSDNLSAKWIKDSKTDDIWYWPAEAAHHSAVAKLVGISEYTKGIAIMEK
jgi:hypothetical protein